MQRRSSALGDILRFTGYVLGALLLQGALYPVLSAYPVPTALVATGLAVGLLIYLGLLDWHAVSGFLSAPFRAAVTLRQALLTTIFGLGVGAILLEWMEVLTWIPGTLVVLMVLGFLMREFRAPWRRFDQIKRMAMTFDDPPLEEQFDVAVMLRKPALESDQIRGSAKELQDLLHHESADDDLSYNLPAWQVVWLSFSIVMGLALLFPAVGVLAPGALEGDDIPIWRWFLFGLEQIMLDDPIELFGLNEFLEDRLDSPSIELTPPGLAMAILTLRIAVSVVLVRAAVAHFEILSSLKRLVRAAGTPRLQELTQQPAFGRLRVLRPMAEASLGRMLVRERERLDSIHTEQQEHTWPVSDPTSDHDPVSKTVRTLVSLLKQERNLPKDWTLEDWRRTHFQTRLALINALSTRGHTVTPAWLRERFPELSPLYVLPDTQGRTTSWEALCRNQTEVPRVAQFAQDIFGLLRGLNFLPATSQNEPVEDWILRPDSDWPANWKSTVLADGRFLVLLACLAQKRDKDILLRTLSHVPGASREIRRAWATAWPQQAPLLTVEEEGQWVSFCSALDSSDGWLEAAGIPEPILQRVKNLGSLAIDFVLIERLQRAQREGERQTIFRALAYVGVGDRALNALMDRWKHTLRQDERLLLVEGVTRLGKNQTDILHALAETWNQDEDPRLWHSLLRGLTHVGQDHPHLHDILLGAYRQRGLQKKRRDDVWNALCNLRNSDQLDQLSTWAVESILDPWGLVFRKLPPALHLADPEGFRTVWLADFPITNRVWETMMAPSDRQGEVHESNGTEDLPKVGITWLEAVAFCERLTLDTANDIRYRLPTSLEWHSPKEGMPLADNAIHGRWNIGNNTGCPSPRGLYCPDAGAIFDRIGNVWEWCQDGPTEAPAHRWVRGGCWDTQPQQLNPEIDVGIPARTASPRVGFRIVMERT